MTLNFSPDITTASNSTKLGVIFVLESILKHRRRSIYSSITAIIFSTENNCGVDNRDTVSCFSSSLCAYFHVISHIIEVFTGIAVVRV